MLINPDTGWPPVYLLLVVESSVAMVTVSVAIVEPAEQLINLHTVCFTVFHMYANHPITSPYIALFDRPAAVCSHKVIGYLFLKLFNNNLYRSHHNIDAVRISVNIIWTHLRWEK